MLDMDNFQDETLNLTLKFAVKAGKGIQQVVQLKLFKGLYESKITLYDVTGRELSNHVFTGDTINWQLHVGENKHHYLGERI